MNQIQKLIFTASFAGLAILNSGCAGKLEPKTADSGQSSESKAVSNSPKVAANPTDRNSTQPSLSDKKVVVTNKPKNQDGKEELAKPNVEKGDGAEGLILPESEEGPTLGKGKAANGKSDADPKKD